MIALVASLYALPGAVLALWTFGALTVAAPPRDFGDVALALIGSIAWGAAWPLVLWYGLR